MVPALVAGLHKLAGVDVAALTDHNTTRNCPAFFEAAQRQGIIPVAGMELTTAEDIHVVCLFPTLETALAFNDAVDARRIRIPNRKDIFGEQLIMDSEDNVIGEEEHLLSNATTLSVEDVPQLVERYGGVCYPAHIDREANGIISVLGTFPETPHFDCVELHNGEKQTEYTERFSLEHKVFVVSSDAHYLTDMREENRYFELNDEPYSSAFVRRQLFKKLGKKI